MIKFSNIVEIQGETENVPQKNNIYDGKKVKT